MSQCDNQQNKDEAKRDENCELATVKVTYVPSGEMMEH